jgi:hypothetical protein
MVVASLSSGHVCEYAPSDLVFADGSSVHSAPDPSSLGKAGTEFFKVGDTVTFVSSVIDNDALQDKVLHASSGMIPKVGMKVTATSDKSGAPRGKPTLSFSKGAKFKILKLKEEGGEWYALEQQWKTLWFPLSSTDWRKRAGKSARTGGCCSVTKKNFSAGLRVVRGAGFLFRLVFMT